MPDFTPEQRAALIASGREKQAAAYAQLTPEVKAEMLAHGLVLEYTLTRDEYRVLFETPEGDDE